MSYIIILQYIILVHYSISHLSYDWSIARPSNQPQIVGIAKKYCDVSRTALIDDPRSHTG